MEQLADHGNGTYFFIDGEAEARRAFSHSLSGTLLTIAKDVKVQVQFNPDLVKGYRLIGYDNRTMSNEDFNDDTVDAGELGNGEDVTAFYEIILASSDEEVPPTDVTNDVNEDDETVYEDLEDDTFMAVHLRFKMPDSDTSMLVTHPIENFHELKSPSLKFVFASTVAQLGLVLRESAYIEDRDISELDERILDVFSRPDDEAVAELLDLLELAQLLL
jgi:Ca-activated chloride channel family protein